VKVALVSTLTARKVFEMKLIVRNESPPEGCHTMALYEVEEGVGKWNNPTYVFHFRVTEEGCYHGCEISHTTGTSLKVGNALHNFLGQLFGRELAVAEEIDLTQLIGETYHVEVKERSGDGSKGRTPYILYLELIDDDGNLSSEVSNEIFVD
jgi:hypothetical protein